MRNKTENLGDKKMTKKIKDTRTAADEYAKMQAKVAELLDEIKAATQDTPDRIHWGHVGTMGAIANNLRETLQYTE